MAAPAYRSGTAVTNGTSTSCALSLPSGFASNDILVAVVFKENTAAFNATPTGFALVTGGRNTNDAYSVDIYWKRADGTETGNQSFTWTGSVPRSGYMVAISGCITSGDPWDPATLAAWASNSSAGVIDANTVTTTVAETLLLGVYTIDNGGTTWTSGSSMTERIDNGDTYLQTVEQASAGATGAKSATPSNTNIRKALLVPLQPDAGSPDVTVNASLLTATVSLPAATVVIGSPVTVTPSLLTSTLTLPALPVPTYVGAGTSAYTATNGATISPTLPSGWAENDIHILLAARSQNGATMTSLASDWTQIAALSGSNGALAQSVEVWWRRAVSGDTAPTVTFGTSTTVRGARIFGIRGCPTVGDPFATPSRSNNAASATVSTTNITPTQPSLGLFLYAYEDDPTAASTPTSWGAFAVSSSSLGTDMALGISVRPFIFGTSYGTPSTTVSGGGFANSPNVGILLPMLAPVGIVVRPEQLSLTATLATASAVGESGGGGVTVNAALLTDTLTLFAPTVTAAQNATVTPALLSAALMLPTPTIGAEVTATVTPGLLSLTATQPAPTVSAIRTATIAPALLTATLSLSAATVSTVRTATVTSALLSLTATLPSATATAIRTATLTPSLQTATLSLGTPSVSTTSTATITPALLSLTVTLMAATASAGGTVTVQPSLLTGTLSLFAPTITAIQTSTVQASLLTGTLSLPAPTVSAIQTATVSSDLLTATLSLFAPAVSAVQNATVTPELTTATLSLPAPSISAAQNVTVSPSLLTGTLSLFAPTVSAGGATTINAPLLTLVGSLPEPTVTTVQNVTVTPTVVPMSVTLGAPTVSAGTNTTVTPSPLTMTATLPTPSVSAGTGVTVTPDLLTATATVLAAGISATRNVTATPAQIVAAITLLTPTISTPPNEVPGTVTAGDAPAGGVTAGSVGAGGLTSGSTAVGGVLAGSTP